MSDKVDQLIKEIASKHGIALNRNDPILIAYSINEELLADGTKAQEALLERFQSAIEENIHLWDQNTTNKAEKVLNAALRASKDAMQAEMDENMRVMSETLHKQNTHLLSEMEKKIAAQKTASMMNIGASVFTVLAVIALIFGWI